MKQLELSVEKRPEVGRQCVRKLRREGRVPAVIYGKSGTQPLSFDEGEFRILLKEKGHAASLINIRIAGGVSVLSTIADMQRDPVNDRFLHVDFHEVSRAEKMVTTVPVEFVGESVGVKDFGGVLDIAKHELGVRCLPADLPGHVRVDVGALKVGDIIHIRDLERISGVEFVDGEDVAVVACKSVVEESEESPAEAGNATQTAEASESKEKEAK